MLVLTRKKSQSIMIGDDVEVTVLGLSGDKVRLGIRAPREVPVFRDEVYLEIQQDGRDPRRAVEAGLSALAAPEPAGSQPSTT